MTNMFKKSLVAAAVAGMSVTATAAEITSTANVVSSEWAATIPVGSSDGARVITDSLSVTLESNYTVNDTVTLTFSGNALTSAPNVVSYLDGDPTTIEFGLISTVVNDSGNTEATYRLTDVEGSTAGKTVDFGLAGDGDGNFEFNPRNLGSGVTVQFAAATNTGQPLDTSGTAAERSATLVSVANQINSIGQAGAAGALSATIDVGESRQQFTTATADPAAAFEGLVANDADGNPIVFDADYDVTYDGVVYTVSGDFGWLLDEDGAVDANIAALNVDCGGAAPEELDITAAQIVAECTGNTILNVEVVVDADNESVIPTQSFAVEAAYEYTADSTDIDGGAAISGTASKTLERGAGAWGLNGSEVQVSYMPYRQGITHVMNVTNRSSQAGDISVTAINEAGDRLELGAIATSQPGTITNISRDLIDALTAETGVDHETVGSTVRYAFEIVTNAPAADVEVYSAYNVNGTGARLVVNDSNGGGLSK